MTGETSFEPARQRQGRPAPGQRKVVWIATVVLPLVILAVSTVYALGQISELPDQVPTHWGPSGADRFGSPLENIVILVVVGIILVAVFAVMGLRYGSSSMTRKMSGSLAVAAAVFLAMLMNGLMLAQRGKTEAQVAQFDPDGVITIAFLSAALVAVVVGFLIPADDPMPTNRPLPPDALSLNVEAGEAVLWSQQVSMRGVMVILIGAPVIVILAAMVTKTWFLLIIALLPIALIVIFSSFRARIDRRGFSCQARLGFPKIEVPLDEIESVQVATINPIRDYGGYGYRTGAGGAIGFIYRKGEGIVVQRTGGRRVVATVDDAATAVALLNGLIRRERS